MLSIDKLHVKVTDKDILKGFTMDVKGGEVHAIMGPNGAGKSTLGSVLAGREAFEVTSGSVTFQGEDLLALEVDERAHKGVFLAFQYPVEIPGVSNMEFLKVSVDAMRQHRGLPAYSSMDFLKLARATSAELELDPSFLKRGVNEGFSGGEKKRNEILQMKLLEPSLCVLDETDSGLDIDALQTVAAGVNAMRSPDRAFIIITHYQRLLDFIEPDFVHVLLDGKIVKTGDKQLAKDLETKGYGWLEEEVA